MARRLDDAGLLIDVCQAGAVARWGRGPSSGRLPLVEESVARARTTGDEQAEIIGRFLVAAERLGLGEVAGLLAELRAVVRDAREQRMYFVELAALCLEHSWAVLRGDKEQMALLAARLGELDQLVSLSHKSDAIHGALLLPLLWDPGAEPDPELMKGFNRQFVTGVTVVSTMDGDQARGLAANAYCSISLDPPLIMVCIQRTSSTWPALFRATHLGVNVLGRDQHDVVSVFSSKDPDKFARIDWRPGPHGSPLVAGSAAMLEAEIQERFQAKTHTIFVCRVRHAEVDEGEPMVYKAGRFFDGGALTELAAT